MKILTNENKTVSLEHISRLIDKDMNYAVLDVSQKNKYNIVDYYFNPLVFLETFNYRGVELSIGNKKLMLPLNWSIVMADSETADVAVIPIEDINPARQLHAFVFNPLSGYIPTFEPVKINEIFSDIDWVFPKIENQRFLVIPIEDKERPRCILVINELEQKKLPPIEMSDIV